MATSHREGVPCPLRHASGPPAEAVSGDRAGSTGVNLKGGGFRRAREAEIQTRDADPGRAGAESHQPVCAPRTRASILTGEGGGCRGSRGGRPGPLQGTVPKLLPRGCAQPTRARAPPGTEGPELPGGADGTGHKPALHSLGHSAGGPPQNKAPPSERWRLWAWEGRLRDRRAARCPGSRARHTRGPSTGWDGDGVAGGAVWVPGAARGCSVRQAGGRAGAMGPGGNKPEGPGGRRRPGQHGAAGAPAWGAPCPPGLPGEGATLGTAEAPRWAWAQGRRPRPPPDRPGGRQCPSGRSSGCWQTTGLARCAGLPFSSWPRGHWGPSLLQGAGNTK